MLASLFEKLHSPDYWVTEVLIPTLFGYAILCLRPSWVWVNVATSAYFFISALVVITAHRSGFTPLMSHEGLPGIGPDWLMRVIDFTPEMMGTIFPIFLVLCADATFPPVARKCTKLLQLAVVAASTAVAVYLFATEGWSQPSFHLISFGLLAGFTVSFLGTLLISGISWLTGVVKDLSIEVFRTIQSTSDWITSLQRRVLSRL